MLSSFVEEFFVSHCFYYRVNNKCNGRKNISNQISVLLRMLYVNRNVLPSFENRKKVYEPHTIFQETDGKLRRWLKLGLFRVSNQGKQVAL
jgi:hypothetical protein